LGEIRTIPPRLTRTEWNALVDHGLLKTVSYVVRSGSNGLYEAINGLTGKIDYSGSVFSTVIQNAIDANLGPVLLVSGSYNLGSNTIILSKNGQKLYGFPPAQDTPLTKIIYTGSGTAIKVSGSGGTSIYGFGIENLYVDTNNTGVGIELYNCHWGKLYNVYVYNGTIGIKVDGAWDSEIDHCIVRSCTQKGILLDGHSGAGANHILVRYCYLDGSPINVEVADSTNDPLGITFEHNNFGFGNNDIGIQFSFQPRQVTIRSNYFESPTNVTGNKFIYFSGSASKKTKSVNIENNAFVINSGSYGIYVDYADGISVKQNYVYGYGSNPSPVFVYMTGNATNLTMFKNTYDGATIVNTLTSEAVEQSDELTKAVFFIPFVGMGEGSYSGVSGSYMWINNTSYVYKYTIIKFAKSWYERITDIRLCATVNTGSSNGVYIKLQKLSGSWVDVSGSEIGPGGGWSHITSTNLVNSFDETETEYMPMVRVTGSGTGRIANIYLRVTVA